MSIDAAHHGVSDVNGNLLDARPVDLYRLGLAGCIDRLTGPLRDRGTTINWDTPHWGVDIPPESAILLYRAAREALSNAFTYSDASELTVQLLAVHHGVQLVVADDGSGSTQTRQPSDGLRLMATAVHDAGGQLDISTHPGAGTSVTVTLPLD